MTTLLFTTLTVFPTSTTVSATSSANIPNGWYRFESILSGKFGIHVEGNSKQVGAKVVAHQANNGDNEIWYLEKLPDDSYKLTSKSTSYVLEIGGYDDVRRKEGAQGNIWYWENTDNQHFYIKSTSYGYMLINKLTGMALDVYGGENARNGDKVCQWGYNEYDKAQLWKLIPIESASSSGQCGADWAIAQIGKSMDYDGAYGVQCVDLIKAYYNYLGVKVVGGNGCDYIANALPSGWVRIKNTPDFIPQPGDIAVWTSAVGGGYGHVSIVISGGLHEFTSVDQNWNGKAAHKVTHNYSGFWGVIRPKF